MERSRAARRGVYQDVRRKLERDWLVAATAEELAAAVESLLAANPGLAADPVRAVLAKLRSALAAGPDR